MHRPIETVAEAQRQARRRLSTPVYVSILSGTEKGLTMDRNVSAFDDLGFRARAVDAVPSDRSMTTTVMGQEISYPVITAPGSAHAIWPGGEVMVAKATAAVGTAIIQAPSRVRLSKRS